MTVMLRCSHDMQSNVNVISRYAIHDRLSQVMLGRFHNVVSNVIHCYASSSHVMIIK